MSNAVEKAVYVVQYQDEGFDWADSTGDNLTTQAAASAYRERYDAEVAPLHGTRSRVILRTITEIVIED